MRLNHRILLRGNVQGQGIRPRIARSAGRRKLTGWVRNTQHGVEVMVNGSETAVAGLVSELKSGLEDCVITLCRPTEAREHFQKFEIRDSSTQSVPSFDIPLDRAVCQACLSEATTPGNRRYQYALNSCVECGPRYSMVIELPFDRERTSMAEFAMCADCLAEYHDPTDRRYHAQLNCCPACGPQIWYNRLGHSTAEVVREAPLEVASVAIKQGEILALKGVGGYQLVCDATNESAVDELRRRKRRIAKPLAVMVSSLEMARQLAELSPLEERVLSSAAGPIVLALAKDSRVVARNVHPQLADIGLMLPTTVMHAMLLESVSRPLVMTSANREGEPIHYRDSDAERELSQLADGCLQHDRAILHPVDDSVVRCMCENAVTMRAGRGIAPMRLELQHWPRMLATGGQQKAAFAVSNGSVAVLGAHVGDLQSLANRDRYEQEQEQLGRLLKTKPDAVVTDLHPDYFTTNWAGALPFAQVEATQHHHAHVVGNMLEHQWLNREVLGFAFDGTGYGADGRLWGGEVLLATAEAFHRVAHLRTIGLPGGEVAIREPWRIALACLEDALGDEALAMADALGFDCDVSAQVKKVAASRLSIPTSSFGRLFDAVAAVVCDVRSIQYDGQPAMLLESVADRQEEGWYSFELQRSDPMQIDWRPVWRAVIADLVAGIPKGSIAMRFHRSIAVCVRRIVDHYSDYPVVLSGGVFQNRLLVELISESLLGHQAGLGVSKRIPPGDGGLAAGQLAIAACRNARRKLCV